MKLGSGRERWRDMGYYNGVNTSRGSNAEGVKEGRGRPRPKKMGEEGEVRRRGGPGSKTHTHTPYSHTYAHTCVHTHSCPLMHMHSHTHTLSRPVAGASWRGTAPHCIYLDLSVGWLAGSSTVTPNFPDVQTAKFFLPFIL